MNKFILIAVMLIGALVGPGYHAQAAPTNLVLVGTWPQTNGGSALAVTVAGPYAYVANGVRGLAITDVRNPAQPASVGSYQATGSVDRVYLLGRYAYLSDWSAFTLQVIDVNEPANPVRVGGVMNGRSFLDAQKVGNYLHLAAANLEVFNVSNPASPALAADLDLIGNVLALHIVDNYLYFAGEMWLSIYELSNPLNPTWINTLELMMGNFFIQSLAVANGYAYMGDITTLHVVDVRDPAHPVRVGGQTLSGEIGDMQAVENALFVAHAGSGVSVFDLTDPARPLRVTGYNTLGYANSVHVLGNYVFVADSTNGLVILESQPLRRPPLSLACAETNAVLQWPASALGYRLVSRADLNGTNWIAVPEAPQFTNEVFSVSVPMLTNQFFRLRRAP